MIPKRWINSRNRKKSTLLKRLSKLKNVKKRWGEKAMLETMPISEKLKMLRDRRGLTLDELAEQTGLSRSALSNYETNESKEVSQFALVTLEKFYGVSTDYLLGLSALENPMQGDIHDLNISSEMAELLKSGKINNRLLCEMATHPDFPKLLMDMEIMVDGEARNAIRAIDMLFEAVRMKIVKETNIGEDSNAQILTFKEAQIDEDEYFEMKIKNDLRPILRDKYAERSEGSRQLEEIEKYVQQLIREADIVREQKEQNVPDDEIWIDRTIAMLMAKWKIKWNKLTEVQQRSFKEVLMQSELRKEQLPKKRMRGRKR